MRTLVFQTLKTACAATDVQDRVYQAGSLGVDGTPADPAKPFVTYREGESTAFGTVAETSSAERIPYTVNVYTERGSYVDAAAILRLVRDAVKQLAGVTSPTGNRCIGVDWGGISQDFPDQKYDGSVKFGSFTLVSSQH